MSVRNARRAAPNAILIGDAKRGETVQQFAVLPGVFVRARPHAGIDKYHRTGSVNPTNQVPAPLCLELTVFVERYFSVRVPR